jgi:hypothetical protein
MDMMARSRGNEIDGSEMKQQRRRGRRLVSESWAKQAMAKAGLAPSITSEPSQFVGQIKLPLSAEVSGRQGLINKDDACLLQHHADYTALFVDPYSPGLSGYPLSHDTEASHHITLSILHCRGPASSFVP